jgi:PAS domain S-box-containing protein
MRKRTDQESIDDEALLHAVVDCSDDAIIAKSLDGTIALWNNAAERLFGYSRAEMLSQSADRLVPPERQADDARVIARALEGERIDHFETIRLTKAGDRIEVSLTVSPIRDAAGRLVGLSHAVRDITHQKSIDRQALHLAALVDSSDDAIASKDLDGVVQSWNRAAERMFGFTAPEIIGRSIRTIIPKDLWHEEDEVLRRVRAGDRIEHFDTVRRRKNGTLLPVSLTVSPIRTAEGVIIGASKIARDLSALRAYADALEQKVKDRTEALETANTHLEAFAYSVSHDLRAPLRGMQGLAHALLEDYGGELDARGRDYAARIVAETRMMDQLIQDLLAYSRLAHIEVTLEPVDVRDAVEAALHNLRQDIADRQASVEITGEMPVLQANRTLLVQALTNLLSNAFKFGGSHPSVQVQAERTRGGVRISVEDHGIGIAPQHHDRVFRAFERLHGIEEFPGTGMGLAIVRKGIERLGGRVGLESAEGQGSRFWIELPAAEAA